MMRWNFQMGRRCSSLTCSKVRKQQCSSFPHNPLPQPRRRPRNGSHTSANLQHCSSATLLTPPSIGRPILRATRTIGPVAPSNSGSRAMLTAIRRASFQGELLHGFAATLLVLREDRGRFYKLLALADGRPNDREWNGPAVPLPRNRQAGQGAQTRSTPRRPEFAQSASISARTRFTLLRLMIAAQSCCARSGRAASLKGTQPERLPVQFCMNPTRPKKVEVAATAPSTTFKPSGASGSGAGPAITSSPFLGVKKEPWQEQTNSS